MLGKEDTLRMAREIARGEKDHPSKIFYPGLSLKNDESLRYVSAYALSFRPNRISASYLDEVVDILLSHRRDRLARRGLDRIAQGRRVALHALKVVNEPEFVERIELGFPQTMDDYEAFFRVPM